MTLPKRFDDNRSMQLSVLWFSRCYLSNCKLLRKQLRGVKQTEKNKVKKVRIARQCLSRRFPGRYRHHFINSFCTWTKYTWNKKYEKMKNMKYSQNKIILIEVTMANICTYTKRWLPTSQPSEDARLVRRQHYRAVLKYCVGGKNLEWSRGVFVR